MDFDQFENVKVRITNINKDVLVSNTEIDLKINVWQEDLEEAFYGIYFKSFLDAMDVIPNSHMYDWYKRSCGFHGK
jgi:hypothetical protein